MKKVFNFIGQSKIYISRTNVYVGMFNAFVIFMTFKSVYNLPIPAWMVAVFGFIGIMIIGYIDYRFIALPQAVHNNKKNDVKRDLEKIKRHLGIKE